MEDAKSKKINHKDEDEILLDNNLANSLLWSKQSRNKAIALSQSNNKAVNDKAGAQLDMCEEFWEDFVLMAKVCLLRDKEADLFDVFDTIRTKFLGGWGFTKEFLEKMDAEIEHDYQKELARGLG